MGIRAGDIRQFTWGGREFDVAPEGDVTMILHGIKAESTPNGNGTVHTKGTRVLGGFDGLTLSVDPARGDVEFLIAMQTGGIAKACSMTLVDKTTYGGAMLPEGDLQSSTGNGTLTVAARGAKWERI